jgi:hypothetical protein
MTLRQYLTLMILSSILCWFAWGIVIVNIDPFQSGWFGFIFFYITLFFSCLGTTSIFTFLGYRFFSSDSLPMFRYVKKSFRDACLISVLIIGLLFLQGSKLLNWWNLGALLLVIIFVASFLFSAKRQRPKTLISNQPPFEV